MQRLGKPIDGGERDRRSGVTRWFWKSARNPMLRPAQIVGAGTRLHPPAFGGNTQHRRKSALSQVCRAPLHGLTLWLEWLDHRQQHDEDHQNSRYLIDNTIVFLTVPIVVGCELLDENGQM